jgi:glyoxylase-like metal-dependent hydrolase (beta-lactamase superfamily II)
MYGDVVEIAPRTLMIEGTVPPTSVLLEPDVPNVVLYRPDTTLYVMDTGVTTFFRDKVLEAAERLRPFERVVLLNTHAHPDHVGNNSVVDAIQAGEKAHFLSEKSGPLLQAQQYFTDGYRRANDFANLLDGLELSGELAQRLFDAQGLERPADADLQRFGALATRLGVTRLLNPLVPPLMAAAVLRPFTPMEPCAESARHYEQLPRRTFSVGGVEWTGWDVDGNVYVMEAAGHCADGVICYCPKTRVLFVGDETTTVPIWADTDLRRALPNVDKYVAMVEAGAVDAFVDGHHHTVHRDANSTVGFLQGLLAFYATLRQEIAAILASQPDGLTADEIYAAIKARGNAALAELFKRQFPIFGVFVKQQIVGMLLDMNAPRHGGPGPQTRFTRPPA